MACQPNGLGVFDGQAGGHDSDPAQRSTTPEQEATGSQENRTVVKSLRDLTIIEAWDPETSSPKYVTFYLVTPFEEVYFGQPGKKKMDITLEEYSSLLARIPDNEIFPDVPKENPLTIAPEDLDESVAYIKRPGLNHYESMKGTGFVRKALLDETLIMEQISKAPHPNIIHYYGCRVARGYITAITLERLDRTLTQYSSDPEFQKLDNSQFMAALESAVEHLHVMGLAHNDINPDNIMVKGGAPVLIDFDSCQPFGKALQSLGTPGWCEAPSFTSEKEHDVYSLGKLREWLPLQQSTAAGT